MRAFVRFVAFAAAVLLVSGCDLMTERRYITEGAGVDLYTADRAVQTELLNKYIEFVCAQAGPNCGGNWSLFVQAGMNDIDLRCDGFLTWIDARRRDKEPVLAEIGAITSAVHSVMTVTGSSPKSLDIVTAAFGLANATYTNWNSRLLIAINQSTIQDVVYKGQYQFRDSIKDYRVPDQPAAIYLLRNYLRICMPTTIEAAINTTTTLVQRGAATAAQTNLVVGSTVTPSRPASGGAGTPSGSSGGATSPPDPNAVILEKFLDPDGDGTRKPESVQAVMPFLTKIGLRPRDLTRFLGGPQFAKQRQDLVKELRSQGLNL